MLGNIWNWFNKEERTKMGGYYCWCPKKGVRAVGDEEEDSWDKTFESDDDTGYWWSTTSGASGLSCANGRSLLEPFEIAEDAGKNEYQNEANDQLAGYESFGAGCPFNHRLLWVSFMCADTFGVPSSPLVSSPSARCLTKKNPRLVKKYVKTDSTQDP
jgi:hypothetical protein